MCDNIIRLLDFVQSIYKLVLHGSQITEMWISKQLKWNTFELPTLFNNLVDGLLFTIVKHNKVDGEQLEVARWCGVVMALQFIKESLCHWDQ